MVGPNGFRLSGGQRQRIALARAILRNAEILVLDEATSQVDVESERLIHESLARYVENRTVIMITHRASTLALADTIVHVEHGTATKKPASQHRAA
jgi:ATP-binding cassette subfamily B protein/subfamily B ATP-binding cassette protein MsbA